MNASQKIVNHFARREAVALVALDEAAGLLRDLLMGFDCAEPSLDPTWRAADCATAERAREWLARQSGECS